MRSLPTKSSPLHVGPQRLQKPQRHSIVCKTSSPLATRWTRASTPGSVWSCRRSGLPGQRSFRSPGQAVYPATASRITVCSAGGSSQDFATAGSSSFNNDDDSRKASNAAASTSASQPAAVSGGSKRPDSLTEQFFLAVETKLVAIFRSITAFFKGLPAFVQREKLQRLHKRALDDPTNPER